MIRQPRRQAVFVVNVSTRHEHAHCVQRNRVTANCAARFFHFTALAHLLAVLVFDANFWKLFDCVNFRSFLPLLGFGLLLTYAPNHFKEVVGLEALVEVGHERVGVEL